MINQKCEYCENIGKLVYINGIEQIICQNHINEILELENQYKEILNESLMYSGHLQPRDI